MRKLIAVLLLVSIYACNPVKQVKKDVDKTRKVFDYAVINYGWCVNDTSFVFKEGRIDSIPYPVLIEKKVVDTSAMNKAIENAIAKNDTICIDGIKESYYQGYNDALKELSKKKLPVKQPDTIKATVTDIYKEGLLKKEADGLRSQIVTLKMQLIDKSEQVKSEHSRGNEWRNKFWFLVAAALAIIFRKQLIKGFARLFSLLKLII